MSMNKVQKGYSAIKTGPFGNHSACQPLCMNTVAEATSLTLGRRVTVVVLSFIPSFCPPRYREHAVLTSSRQLRYKQARHVDGLQSDWWILLKINAFVLELWLAHRDGLLGLF